MCYFRTPSEQILKQLFTFSLLCQNISVLAHTWVTLGRIVAPICHAFVVTFFMFLDFEQIEHLKCSTVRLEPGLPWFGVVVWWWWSPSVRSRLGVRGFHRGTRWGRNSCTALRTPLSTVVMIIKHICGISPHLICCWFGIWCPLVVTFTVLVGSWPENAG